MKTDFRVKETHSDYEFQLNSFSEKKKDDRTYFEWYM